MPMTPTIIEINVMLAPFPVISLSSATIFLTAGFMIAIACIQVEEREEARNCVLGD